MQLIITANDQATPALDSAVRVARRPRAFMQAAGKAAANAFREHFKDRQAEGNVKGWPSRRFWFGVKGSVANATAMTDATDTSATVTVADPRFVHKITGGTVTPKRRKFLSIPLRAAAYALGGKGSVRESQPDLFPIRTARGLWLVRNKAERRGRQVGKGRVKRVLLEFWFKLVRSVTHQADPRALPPPGAIERAIDNSAIVLKRILDEKNRA